MKEYKILRKILRAQGRNMEKLQVAFPMRKRAHHHLKQKCQSAAPFEKCQTVTLGSTKRKKLTLAHL